MGRWEVTEDMPIGPSVTRSTAPQLDFGRATPVVGYGGPWLCMGAEGREC